MRKALLATAALLLTLEVILKPFFCLFGAFLLPGCAHRSSTFVEGTYGMTTGYVGEKIEFENGSFRYWYFTDKVYGGQPVYPFTGNYSVKGEKVTLIHPEIDVKHRERIYKKVNGRDTLWLPLGANFEGNPRGSWVLMRHDGDSTPFYFEVDKVLKGNVITEPAAAPDASRQ